MLNRRMLNGLWTGLVALSAAAASMGQVSVVLRPAAELTAGSGPITLGDVAEIDPPTTPEAMRLAEIVVAQQGSARSGTIEVPVAKVRSAMDEAGAAWGRITLRGSVCRVTVGAAETAAVTRDPRAPSLSQTVPQPVELEGASDIRGAISSRLVELYNVAPEDVRLAFDAGDEAFLKQAGSQGDRRVDVQPTGTGASGRTGVNVFVYEGDRLVQTKLVPTQALVNRAVLTARAPIAKNQAIGPDDVEIGRQWLPPNAKVPAAADAVIGQVASRAIAAGTVVSTADVTSAVVCKRGDIIWVHALAGGVTVRAKARAMGQARDGELVQLKLDGSDQVFAARMSGRGKAVMKVDAEKQPEGETP